MNFKKIALVLAMTAGFGAQAADPALNDLTALAVPGFVANEVLSTSSATVYGDFLTATPAGNKAYVLQDSGMSAAIDATATDPAVPAATMDGGSVAYVTQQDAGNYAIVMQQGKGGFAWIDQKADGANGGAAVNKAMIVQIDTGTAVRAIDLTADIGTKSVDDLAKAEIAASARVLSATGKGAVALIAQSDALFAGTSNTALIYQNATDSFAAISQTANPTVANDAYVAQSGKGMVAYIVQK